MHYEIGHGGKEAIYKTVAESYNKNSYYEKFRKNRVLTKRERFLLDKFRTDILINNGYWVAGLENQFFAGNAQVLSVGCGDACLFETYLTQQGNITITGVDISEEQVRRARKNLPLCDFICENFLDMNPAAHNAFDGIICMYALFNFIESDQYRALSNMWSMLRDKGGRCLINIRLEQVNGIKYDPSWCGEKMYWTLPGLVTVLDWCSDIGFKYQVFKNPDNTDYVFVMLER